MADLALGWLGEGWASFPPVLCHRGVRCWVSEGATCVVGSCVPPLVNSYWSGLAGVCAGGWVGEWWRGFGGFFDL